MKRTTFVLDEQLLEEATALSGERTFSRTIERALREMVRRLKARDLLSLAGSGIWQGDLSAMRGDVTSDARSPAAKLARAGQANPSALASRATAGAGVRERSPIYRPRTKKPRSGR